MRWSENRVCPNLLPENDSIRQPVWHLLKRYVKLYIIVFAAWKRISTFVPSIIKEMNLARLTCFLDCFLIGGWTPSDINSNKRESDIIGRNWHGSCPRKKQWQLRRWISRGRGLHSATARYRRARSPKYTMPWIINISHSNDEKFVLPKLTRPNIHPAVRQ